MTETQETPQEPSLEPDLRTGYIYGTFKKPFDLISALPIILIPVFAIATIPTGPKNAFFLTIWFGFLVATPILLLRNAQKAKRWKPEPSEDPVAQEVLSIASQLRTPIRSIRIWSSDISSLDSGNFRLARKDALLPQPERRFRIAMRLFPFINLLKFMWLALLAYTAVVLVSLAITGSMETVERGMALSLVLLPPLLPLLLRPLFLLFKIRLLVAAINISGDVEAAQRNVLSQPEVKPRWLYPYTPRQEFEMALKRMEAEERKQDALPRERA